MLFTCVTTRHGNDSRQPSELNCQGCYNYILHIMILMYKIVEAQVLIETSSK